MQIKIDDIIIPENRMRKLGDINSLAESIKNIGLIHPITVNKNNILVSGLHRLEACKLLGWEQIEINIVSVDQLQQKLIEIDENLIRNDFLALERSEHLAERKRIYEELYPETQKGSFNQYTKVLKTESDDSKLSFVSDTSKKTGRSETVIKEELQIANNIIPEVKNKIRGTELENKKTELLKIAKIEPEKQNEIVNKITSGEAKNVLEANRLIIKENLKSIELPEGVFNVILVDPPWKYDFAETENRAIENHYPTMDIEDIKNIEIPSADDSVLFLWVTAPKLIEGIEVMKAWGFEYKTCAVWDKEIIGMGYWFRGQHELLLVGTKGKYSPPEPVDRFSSVIRAKRTEHSKKPEIVYEMIEKMFPNGQYLEFFARNKFNDKWSVWGNQYE